MEDYKKKYYDLIDRLRKATGDNNVNDERYCCVITDIVPELNESEDERIRRNIRAALIGEGYYDCDLTNECIAWVEKQGKQKPFDYENANIQQTDFAPKIEKQGEQKPSWCVEDENMLNLTLGLLSYHRQCRNWLRSLKERIEGE